MGEIWRVGGKEPSRWFCWGGIWGIGNVEGIGEGGGGLMLWGWGGWAGAAKGGAVGDEDGGLRMGGLGWGDDVEERRGGPLPLGEDAARGAFGLDEAASRKWGGGEMEGVELCSR